MGVGVIGLRVRVRRVLVLVELDEFGLDAELLERAAQEGRFRRQAGCGKAGRVLQPDLRGAGHCEIACHARALEALGVSDNRLAGIQEGCEGAVQLLGLGRRHAELAGPHDYAADA